MNEKITIREYAKENKMPSHVVMRKMQENGLKPRNITQKVDKSVLDKLFFKPELVVLGDYCRDMEYKLEDVIYFFKSFNKRQFKQRYGAIEYSTEIDIIYIKFYQLIMQPDILPKQYGYNWQQYREAKRGHKVGITFKDADPKMTYYEIKQMRLVKSTNKKIYNKGNPVQGFLNREFNRWIIENEYSPDYLIYEQMGFPMKQILHYDKDKLKSHYKYNKFNGTVKYLIEKSFKEQATSSKRDIKKEK